jgi:hypothetical protein
MPAIVKNPSKRWNKVIPYKIENATIQNLETLIGDFNRHFSTPIFVPYTNQKDYVVFQNGADSPIGKQGEEQKLKCTSTNLYHEMGHCCGLGHTYFHTGCKNFTDMFEGIDKQAFYLKKGDYENQGNAFQNSMMAYKPDSFTSSHRIKRIIQACGGNRSNLTNVEKDIRKLQELLKKAKDVASLKPSDKFTLPSLVPLRLKFLARNFRELSALTTEALQSFLWDVGILKSYWRFDDNHMMRIDPADKVAIEKVIGL